MKIDYCNDIETAISIVNENFPGKIYHDIFLSNQDRPQIANIFAVSTFTDANLNDIFLFLYKKPSKKFIIKCVQCKYNKSKEKWEIWYYSQIKEGCRDKRLDLPKDACLVMVGGGSSTTVSTNNEFWDILEKSALS